MRLTRLFPPTLREPPTNCPSPGLAWLIRAGYLRLSESGWIHLPLGQRVLEQVKRILESEMSHLEAQRIGMPLSSGTDSHTPWDALDYTWDLPEPASPLAATQLEIIQNLAQRDLQTYRQLPCLLYHISPLATAPWERLAPLHLNSSVVLEAFALISAPAAQEGSQRRFLQAAGNTFQRLGLTVRLARAGLTDALSAQILWLPHPQGDLSILHCSQCTYAALEAFATFKKPEPSPETPSPHRTRFHPGGANHPRSRRLP
jgi:prolyl-tRNA synthetase